MITISKVLALGVLLSRWSEASSSDECYIGCYKDDRARDLKHREPGRFTVSQCRDACKSKNYKVFSVQYGYECFCDNVYGGSQYKKVDDKECRRSGFPAGTGGPWRNSIYNVECSAPAPAPAPGVDDEDCDWGGYLDRYEDLRKAYGDKDYTAARLHYNTYGEKEGRDCTCPKLLGDGVTNIPLDHIVDYAFLSDKIWTTDNTGYLTDANTGAHFTIDYELDTEYGRMWLVRTKHRGGQNGECVIAVKQEELYHDSSLENDEKWAYVLGGIKMIPEKIVGTDFYVMKQYNQMGSEFVTTHGMIIQGWLQFCSSMGAPDITLTGHSLGGAVAMWFAYVMEYEGVNILGTQDTEIRVGRLVTFDAPPVHFPSSSDTQDICPKELQDIDVAVNFLRGGLTGPVQEDTSFTTWVWSPWSIKSHIKGMAAEKTMEWIADSIGRDCVSTIELEQDTLDKIYGFVPSKAADIVNWIASFGMDDETKVYQVLVAASGDYNRRDEFKRYCGDRKALADFGCGCGAGYKTNGKCPPKVQFRSAGTCPVFDGLFAGAKESLDMDTKRTIDAPACAEFCTQLEDCQSWYFNKKEMRCHALSGNNTSKKTKDSNFQHGLRCPKVRESFMERNVQYVESDPKNVFYDQMKIDSKVATEKPEDLCAEGCGLNPGCKSWVFHHPTKMCKAFRTYMPGRKPANGYTSGLPQRVTTENLKIPEQAGVCCGDKEMWSDCGFWGSNKCPQGWNYETYRYCGFMATESFCKQSCGKKDWGCGCQEELGKCSVGLPPQSHENFVRFCEHPGQKGRCCDQTGTQEGRAFDLDVLAGCPRLDTLSSIEVVGDCQVNLFTKKMFKGKQYTIIGEGRYNAGSKTFPSDAVSFAKVTCDN